VNLRRIGLLFGGSSVEHEVSVSSARAVGAAIREAGFECVPIAVTGDGRWLAPEESARVLDSAAERVETSGRDAAGPRLGVDPGRGLVRLEPGSPPTALEVDVVFPLWHGRSGEDGRLQGLLDIAGVPYVGAGVTGSAAGMDKIVAKRLFTARGLPGTPWIECERGAFERDPASVTARIRSELEAPWFVKPANGGSSVGVTKVAREEALSAALAEAFAYDHRALVETGIPAREIECAVLGNQEPEASIVGEIVPSGEFYDYAAKYLDGASELKIPAPIAPATAETVRRLSIEAFRALGLAGLARVDFLLDRRDGRVYLNEVNTLPGFTTISMFPKLWEASGLSFPRLVGRLVDLARERWEADLGLRTRWEGAGRGRPA
jgi:D-alanine-D-alanine ligase